MWLEWNVAAAIAVVLGLGAFLARGTERRWLTVVCAFARETAIILVLYAAWQRAGQLSVMQGTDARARALSIWNFERALHLPSELSVQAAVLPHPLWVQACNAYYAIVHMPSLIIFLVWLFVRHRADYPRVRNTIALLTGTCLAIQLIPVAPPRMLHSLGFVDTGLLYHQSVYTALGSGAADQLSAMPSVHVGWAVVIGAVVVGVSRSRWRWLVLLHTVGTIIVVAATANHFWMDGIVAVAILAVAWGVEWCRGALVARVRGRASRRPVPVPSGVTPGVPVAVARSARAGSWVGTEP